MTIVTLICPHCGNNFELDSTKNLQPFWVCPYCGNRSLMQKSDDVIRLRGIIPGRSLVQQNELAEPSETPPEAPPPPTIEPVEKAIEPVIPRRPLEEIIAEAENKTAEPTFTHIWPVVTEIDDKRPSEVPFTAPPVINQGSSTKESVDVPYKKSMADTEAAPAVHKETTPDLEQLCERAKNAAFEHNLPLFNCYSRQVIDLAPEDPRMYTLRAVLTEEADGFAKATWTAPYWSQLTPKRKKAALAQHLYNLNAALRFSPQQQQQELINRISRLLVRQAHDFFTEQAELRCMQNLIFKTFKGHFRGSDLRFAKFFTEAMKLIDQSVCPEGNEQLVLAVRNEIRQLPHFIARRLKRI